MTRILLVEDEKNLGTTLVERFKREGYEMSWKTNCQEAVNAIQQNSFDLAILDVGLPDGSGFEVAERVRAEQPSTAVIFLTAFGSAESRVQGLELGAEDYVVKPFHLKELSLRIKNVLRRTGAPMDGQSSQTDGVEIGQACIYFSRFVAKTFDQREVSLSSKEIAVLKLLLEKRNTVVSRDEILDYAWSKDEYPTPRTVDNFIMRLRRLIEPNPEDPQHIKSVRGVGYILQ